MMIKRKQLRKQVIWMSIPAGMRRPGTSPEGPQKVLTSGTSRRPPGDLQGTLRGPTQKLMIQWKNCFLDAIVFALHLYNCFFLEKKYSKVLNGDVHGTSTGLSCRTSRRPNNGTSGDAGRRSYMFFKSN